jgi:hypothetical protein
VRPELRDGGHAGFWTDGDIRQAQGGEGIS